MNIYVDDFRDLPENFDRCHRSCEGFWEEWQSKLDEIDILSLDHDLGLHENGVEALTGYQLLCKIEEKFHENGKLPKYIQVHSSNPVGKQRMNAVIEKLYNK